MARSEPTKAAAAVHHTVCLMSQLPSKELLKFMENVQEAQNSD